jgi:hypothetical protein
MEDKRKGNDPAARECFRNLPIVIDPSDFL